MKNKQISLAVKYRPKTFDELVDDFVIQKIQDYYKEEN